MIFVFGSNTRGAHGKGAALTALKYHSAVYGQAHGLQGESYAIATCNGTFKPLNLPIIRHEVEHFMQFAKTHPELNFKVTRVGCGLGRYKNEDIAPMFTHAPDNCFFDEQWQPYLGETHAYWGTY